MKRSIAIWIVLFTADCMSGLAQNFVPNGSFENYQVCPLTRNDGRRSDSWATPTLGTSDYFNTCVIPPGQATQSVDVPLNFAGTQQPRTGNAYAGFYASQNFAEPFLEYREYMQVTLDSFLVAGGVYFFEMYVSLGDNSNFASNRIGAYISQDRISATTTEYLNYVPQIISSGYITDKTGWTRISGTYTATGGEHYITIGVYEPASSNTRISVTGGLSSPQYEGVSYYYLDDVSMTRACDLTQNMLGSDKQVCAAKYTPVSLSASGTTAGSYLWNTGDTTPAITADTPGKYILKVSSALCTVYDTVTVSFTEKPTVNLGKDTSICGLIPLTLKATTSGATGYQWSTGSTDSVIHAHSNGKYWVKITKGQCSGTDTINIQMITLQPFSLGPDAGLCTNVRLTLSVAGNTGYSVQWSTGDSLRQITIDTGGIYWARVYSGSCSITDSVLINDLPVPSLNLGNDTASCFNHPLTLSASGGESYLWNNGSQQQSIVITRSGTYWVDASLGTCLSRDTIVIAQKTLPVLELGSSRKLCYGTTVDLNAGNQGASFLWDDQSVNQIKTVTAPAFAYVTVTNSSGCFATDTIMLDTFTTPVVSLGSDSTLCTSNEFRIDAGDFVTYAWNTGATSRSIEPEQAGYYAVTVKDMNNCSAVDSIHISYYPVPSVWVVPALRICEPDTLITAVSSFNNLVWQDGSTSSSYRITDYGNYSVTVTDTNNCTNTANMEVTSTCPGNINVPNVFTPENNDGLNETFFPVVRNIRRMNMQIYTRWGELVYETNDPAKGWDGTYRNQPAQADVYVYRINYTGLNNKSNVLVGNVTLLK